MQSKYKIGLLRGNLLAAALLLALLAPAAPTLPEALLLWLATGWLGVTAALLEFSHRRPAMVPWQLLPSLLLAALLWVAPERYLIWLWAWAVLIMLPQPAWMTGLNVLLAGLTWWSLQDRMSLEQAALSGLVLAGLLLLGLVRSRELQPLRGPARRRMRLIPGLRLWPRSQLSHDLVRERVRARREGVHAELLLLRTSPGQLWPLARRLCRFTRSFENCYRLDRRTLATLLLSRDAEQAEQRRDRLLQALDTPARLRVAALPRVESLDDECRALERQHSPMTVIRELEHD
ncbi:hypothetical protein MKP05_11640 [Halomonas sp. EGI 63088]|uniref:GGDEF domain-containing protein n=1 Tax=Halomonas flagellata TaxID=2920385 RepID=A0ABS9RVA7_9GAMM|nr:hypothetical protein [Halomonas flagellata]MCH4563782.1 hypothetical protein [Halomonas flagellata]